MTLTLNANGLQDKAGWSAAEVALPKYDWRAMADKTAKAPAWVHFGAGNIFRGFIAGLQNTLLNEGLAETGIVAAETFDGDIIEKIYLPHDHMTLNVTLNADGSTKREVLASIAEGLRVDGGRPEDLARLRDIFAGSSLQMASFTITEKGYALADMSGKFMPVVEQDMLAGPSGARHAMSIVTAMMHARYTASKAPIALVSMDNCSHNGEKLRNAVLTIADAWQKNGFVDAGFVAYLSDEAQVAFPWSMIDKITPRPDQRVADSLSAAGIADMAPIVTGKNTFIAPFVNAEQPQYLVVEDDFPAGRPALEKAGVYLTDRDTVNQTERMKVTTCLNPLHTAMSMYGCLLGYTLICEEMKDQDIVALIRRLGYVEGLPVVVDPKILSPKAFIDEVIDTRLPNPFMPDAPQRIATDTSQKVGIRFGETIKSYRDTGRDMNELVSIPLALAGWLRYLLAVDDAGNAMEVSGDPLKAELQALLSDVIPGKPETYHGQILPILENSAVFGVNLTEVGLAPRIEQLFCEMLAGPGSVRATLQKHLL